MQRNDVSLNEAMKHLNVAPMPIGGKPEKGLPEKDPNGKKPMSHSIVEKRVPLTRAQKAAQKRRAIERLAAFDAQKDAAQLMKMKKHVWTGKMALEESRSKYPLLPNIRIAGTVIKGSGGVGDFAFVVKADVDGSLWAFRNNSMITNEARFLTQGVQPYLYQQVTKLNGESTPFMLAPGQDDEGLASYGFNYIRVGAQSGIAYLHEHGTRVEFMPFLARELARDQYDSPMIRWTMGKVTPAGRIRWQESIQPKALPHTCAGVATLISRITV